MAAPRTGDTAVVMGYFCGFTSQPAIEPFFAAAGLPWAPGSYHRTTLALNREAVGQDVAAKLAPEYR